MASISFLVQLLLLCSIVAFAVMPVPYAVGQPVVSQKGSNLRVFPGNTTDDDGKVDACQSKTEFVTPYRATNRAGKELEIINTELFPQAIHVEVCSQEQTSRCSVNCGCEQKYLWHRLLASDPDHDCPGIFMDWFRFPSSCVCKCEPLENKTADEE